MGVFTDRTGEKWITKENEEIEIIEYFGSNNCTVKFSDGVILKNKKYFRVRKGEIIKPLNRTGEVYIIDGCKLKIIEY